MAVTAGSGRAGTIGRTGAIRTSPVTVSGAAEASRTEMSPPIELPIWRHRGRRPWHSLDEAVQQDTVAGHGGAAPHRPGQAVAGQVGRPWVELSGVRLQRGR